MKYRKYFKLPNVKWFCINNNSLLANSIDEVFSNDGIPLLKSDLSLQEIKFIFPYYFISDIEGNSFLINQNLIDIDFLEKCVIKGVFDKGSFIVSKNGQTQSFDLKGKILKPILDFKIFKFIILNQKLIFYKNENISFFDINQNYAVWSFPLTSLGTYETSDKEVKTQEVQQFIGVYNEKLWVRTNIGHFFALDINSGQLLHHLQGVSSYDLHGSIDEYLGETDLYQFFFRNNYILNTDRGVIIGLGGDRYFEIDINSEPPKSSIYGMMDQMKEFGIKPGNIGYNQVLKENKLYFITSDQGVFGIIDTITKKLIYVSDPIEIISKNGLPPQLREIQVSDDKVYVLASDNTLHIFEKENE